MHRATRHVADGPVVSRWTAAAVWLVVLTTASNSTAQLRQTGTIATSTDWGLTMTVDFSWPKGNGYRPVRITVTPTTPSTIDKTLDVVLRVRGEQRYYRRHDQFDRNVEMTIEVPAGSGPVEATLSVPHVGRWERYSIEVTGNGEARPKLSSPAGGSPRSQNLLNETAPTLLVVGATLPDTSTLAGMLPDRGNNPRGMLASATALPAGALPERWIDYTNLDVVCLSLQELAGLKRKHPARLAALLEWTATGGNLWVHGVGEDWQKLTELGTLAGLPAGAAWTPPSAEDYTERAQGAPARATAKEPHFKVCPYEAGMVVAFAEDPFPGTRRQWSAVLNVLGPDRCLWQMRHGLSTDGSNSDYWNLQIPGVGRTPVGSFLMLITLFVLAIGPLNYWLLRRKRKLHLLVLTVPVGAGAVTGLMLLYALVADGLSTRVRVRSLTQIDQRRGHAVCFSRLSYYAGLAPADGLRFPEDVAIYPFEYGAYYRYYRRRNSEREIVWDDGQRLTKGWISSRTPMQLLTVRSRPSERGLTLLDDGGSGQPRVLNRLGTPIRHLFVRLPSGDCGRAEDVGAGATVELTPITQTQMGKQLNRITTNNSLDASPRDPRGYYGRRPRRRSSDAFATYDGSAWADTWATQEDSCLERAIASLRSPHGGDGALATRGSYAAIVEQSPEVELGVESAREEASFHVILGRW